MQIESFMNCIDQLNSDFFTGVPDSLLSPFCNYLMNTYGISNKHIIAANEGNCAAIAAGYHLSTGKVPLVYLQNSGIGNIFNPYTSLLNDKVYGIPCIFVIGWRGEPGVKDEPQHVFQGEITCSVLELMDIEHMIIDKSTTEDQLISKLPQLKTTLEKGKCVAFVVKKAALTYDVKTEYVNSNSMQREEIIRHITAVSGEDLIVSTTGKASRELFEIREQNNQSHQYDFLTVGSMGHSSSIALGIAMNKPNSKIWCIDGDGAALMHMGAMAVIGANAPDNLVHVVINNSAHETVGGLPTVANQIDLVRIAAACGYKRTLSLASFEALDSALREAKASHELTFIEVKASLGVREDLGRPTTTAKDNKISFMKHLSEVE